MLSWSRTRPALDIAATWLLGSLLAWGLVLALETLRHAGEAAGVLGEIAYLGRLAALQTLLFGPLPLLLFGLRWLLDRPNDAAESRGVRVTTWTVAALAVWPAWAQAQFLTSGSAISDLTYGEELRFALCATLVLGYAALWRWHLGAFVAGGAGWYLAGALALALLVYALSFQLKAYAFFAQFLLPPAWFIASAFGYRALRALPLGTTARVAGALGVPIVLWGLGALAPGELARARSTYMRRGKVAALSDALVHPSDAEFASLNALPTKDLQCAAQPPARMQPQLAVSAAQRRNVVLVSIDALRADALAWTQRGVPVMPRLRAFAQQSLRFERAVTTYPATLMAIGGALTGLNASQILFAPKVPENLFKLTRMHFASQYVSLPDSRWFRKKIVDRLFVQGARAELHAGADRQTAALIGRLKTARSRGERILSWVHYYEPHQEYEQHKGLWYGDDSRGRYMSELAFVDRQLGKLFAYLEHAHYFDDSLVIVFADHGEAMGELDYDGHHVYLNSWITDIPLLVRAPGVSPRVSPELADISDIAVTVLHFAGVAVPPAASGLSLLLPDAERRGRVSFAEAFPIRGDRLFKVAADQVGGLKDYRKRMDRIHRGAKNYLPKVSAVSAHHRLIVNRVTGLEEFYDRRADAAERHDLSFEQRPEHRALRTRLAAWSAEQAELLYCGVVRERAKKRAARRAAGK